jgi:glycosyltransferase A (GT-A) superfamily protein (DUF2064 family)
MARRDVIIVQLRNPTGKEEPLPVLRVFDDVKMLRLKRAFFEDTIRQAAEVKDVDIKIAVAPPSRAVWAEEAIEHLSERFSLQSGYRNLAQRTEIITQEVEPLEKRTACSLQKCLENGYQRTVLVGGYTPTLEPQRIEDALNHLRAHPLILGPTIEGGCYLIGLRSDCRDAIGLVTVGSDVAYKNSIANLAQAGISWQEIDLSYDVGHQEDLEYVVREINHCRYTGDEETGRCTEQLIAEFIKGSSPPAGDG